MAAAVLEGFWAAVFAFPGESEAPVHGAVVFLKGGKLMGGDSWYFYSGQYSETTGGKFTATITSTHYAGPIGESPVMGNRRQVNIESVETDRGAPDW